MCKSGLQHHNLGPHPLLLRGCIKLLRCAGYPLLPRRLRSSRKFLQKKRYFHYYYFFLKKRITKLSNYIT